VLKNYKELKAWQKAYAFCMVAYKVTSTFPVEEKYGLTSQIRRSAVSIPSNIAEGYGRKTTADYIRMLYIAYGSLCELETQLMIANDLNYLKTGEHDRMQSDLSDVERMLKALIRSLELKSSFPSTP
jgi:four helix bundle protein